MNKLFTQLLQIRNIKDDFLNPKYESLEDPFSLPDMEPAITRIKQALKNHDQILIYGDYDVDGVTSSTVMKQALELAGAKNIEIMLPDRFADGYGMSPRLVERAKKQNINLVITVDCGSGNREIVEELNTAGIDTIVTDHHECPHELPEAIAIVNPKRPDYSGNKTLRDLAGVGVAFKVAQALVREGLIPEGQEKWLLDLVLIGTICDNMTLSRENRILTFYGMKVLAKTRRPGLKELMRAAGVKTLKSEAIGFQIGPRLNAAGRLKTADLSLELLLTTQASEAAKLTAKLEELNQKRRLEQTAALKEIKAKPATKNPVIVEAGNWHEGVLGIIAGHLVEDYHKPAFVLTKLENDLYKGSGRSFGDFDLSKALDYAKDIIIGGGGHAGAAGVKLAADQLEPFTNKLVEYYKSLHLTDQEKYFNTAADLTLQDFQDLSLELLSDIAKLEPFGEGNPEPIFKIEQARILHATRMGGEGQHLRLDIEDKNGRTLKLVAFFAPEKWFNLDQDTLYNFFIKLVENDFNNVKTVEARLLNVV